MRSVNSFAPSPLQVAGFAVTGPKGATSMACFYEIRNSKNAVLRRDGGFATQDAAKMVGREDARKMKSSCQPDRKDAISVNENHIFRPEFF